MDRRPSAAPEGEATARSGGAGVRQKSPSCAYREIIIAKYGPAWPAKFQIHGTAIARVLGASALQIEHIGSTSVPGLAAKPIIDILIVVKDSADDPNYLPELEATGYLLRIREPDWNEYWMLRTPENDVHPCLFGRLC